MFTYPSVHDVGIDTVLQCHSSNGRAWKRACIDNLQLEFMTVEPALGDLGGASFARHGVHDVHRAHYLNSSVELQDGMPSRLRSSQRACQPMAKVTFTSSNTFIAHRNGFSDRSGAETPKIWSWLKPGAPLHEISALQLTVSLWGAKVRFRAIQSNRSMSGIAAQEPKVAICPFRGLDDRY
jgi:hypothetical protein